MTDGREQFAGRCLTPSDGCHGDDGGPSDRRASSGRRLESAARVALPRTAPHPRLRERHRLGVRLPPPSRGHGDRRGRARGGGRAARPSRGPHGAGGRRTVRVHGGGVPGAHLSVAHREPPSGPPPKDRRGARTDAPRTDPIGARRARTALLPGKGPCEVLRIQPTGCRGGTDGGRTRGRGPPPGTRPPRPGLAPRRPTERASGGRRNLGEPLLLARQLPQRGPAVHGGPGTARDRVPPDSGSTLALPR